MKFTIKQGMNQDILKDYPDNYFDSVVTDPPYGIEFLGKDWDTNTGAIETWEQCYRVLKPGGYILAFSAARTYHHLATNIESVGFEIRDQLMWLYGSGFPKAQDIGKAIQRRQGVEETIPQKGINAFKSDGGMSFGHDEAEFGSKKEEVVPTSIEAKRWSGWKTALKPAHEPIVMGRKPFKGSAIDNILTHGTGALNIDATRIETNELKIGTKGSQPPNLKNIGKASDIVTSDEPWYPSEGGRYPSNVMGEITEYQKYFYCPKVSREERHCGFESVPDRVCGPGGDDWVTSQEHQGNNKKGSLDHIPAPFGDVKGAYVDGKRMAVVHQDLQKDSLDHIAKSGQGGMYDNHGSGVMYNIATNKGLDHIPTVTDMVKELGATLSSDGQTVSIPGYPDIKVHGLKHEYEKITNTKSTGNNHPTVKPVELMSYLVKMVTPEGGRVLDPFNGSGSTGMACVEHGFEYTGCELDPDYVEIATRRINSWHGKKAPSNIFKDLFEID